MTSRPGKLTDDQILRYADMSGRVGMRPHDAQHIAISRPNKLTDADKNVLKTEKQDLLVFVKWQNDNYADYVVLTSALRPKESDQFTGYDEIERVASEWNKYYDRLNEVHDNEFLDGTPVTPPAVSMDDIKAQYPEAAAYRLAKSYENSDNSKKYRAGKKAVKQLKENPSNYAEIIAEMKNEWSEAIDGSIFTD